jgi:hypothetical protein
MTHERGALRIWAAKRPISTARRDAAGLLLLAALALSAPGCERAASRAETLAGLVARTEPADTRVLIVGIDGATFSVIDALLAEGALPTTARLIENGVRAPLRSEAPTISVSVWNTIATGRSAAEHGITNFRARNPETGKLTDRLVSSNERKTLALWNLMGPFGKSVGVVGWWASWPAEPVDGWVVSDRMARGRWAEWLGAERGGRLAFPSRLAAELAPMLVDPDDPPLDEIARLADFTEAELVELAAARTPLYSHGLSVAKFAYCAQRSYEEMALHQLRKGQPDLAAVYLIAVDPISHTFWHTYEPEAYEPGAIDLEEAARLGGIIPNLYRHNDAYVGRLLAELDSDTAVFVISDHGFRAGKRLPREEPAAQFAENFDERLREAMKEGSVTVGQPGTHQMNGILIASGGPILAGATTAAGIFDVTPTVLALMGLPVPRDMPGRVLEEIVAPEFWDAHPIRRVDSYEDLISREELSVSEDVDDEAALQMLRALGYIQ